MIARAVQILHREDVRHLASIDALEDGLQVRAAQSFLLQQLGSQGVQVVPVLTQHVVGHLLGLVHQHAHLFVDLVGHVLGRLVAALAAAADERVSVVLAVLHGTHNRAHAVLHHHRAGDVRGHLNIRRSASGRVTKDQLLGCAATHGEDQAGEQLGAVVHALVVLGGGHGMATGTTARQDRHLVNAVDVLHRPGSQRVAALVVGGDLLLVLRDDLRAAARSTHHAVGGLFQRVGGNHVAFHAGGQQGGLVQHVFQVRTRHARGALGQRLQVHVLGQRLVLRMHVQDLLAARQIRVGHRDLAVEAARAQQRWIQNVRTVSGGHQNHSVAVAEAVHFHQQLVQGLLTLVVAAAHAGATLTADRVDLIDEDDARRVLLRLLKQVAHARRTHTDEHLHEVGTGNGEEGHARLAGHGAGQQRLTRTGRAVQQHAARDLCPQRLITARVGQEVADLVQLLHSLVGTGYVIEGCIRVVLVQLLGGGFAEAEGTHATAALHAGQHEHQQREDQQHR